MLCVHELHSKVVRLNQINVIHDLIEEVLAFGFTLQGEGTQRKNLYNSAFHLFFIVKSAAANA